MQVTLEAIKFNHDPSGKTTGAFNLRRNGTESIPIPEWSAASAGRETSPAAYAMSETPTTITIKAKLSCDDPSVKTVWIRALDHTKSQLPAELRLHNVLGEVKPQRVSLMGGQTDYEVFKLKNTRIIEAGASISETIFRWQYSPDAQNWTTFRITKHRVYTVPRLPTNPWEPRSCDPASIHLPWTEVLDYACQWAAGHDDLFRAATAVTEAVNALGGDLVTYGGGAYTDTEQFDCGAFLKLLKTGHGIRTSRRIQTLNCDDCAAIVSTFSNILGCDLSQSGIGSAFNLSFFTNRILPIGESFWRHTSFIHHAVAWDGACDENNILFDACLQIDADHKPGSPPQKPEQPARIRFGGAREMAYAFALAKDAACKPIPRDASYGRRRRRFGKVRMSENEIEDENLLGLLKRIYNFESWPGKTESNAQSAEDSYRYFERHPLFHGWKVASREKSQNKHGTKILRLILERADEPERPELLAVNIFEPSRNSSDFLLQLLGNFQERMERLEKPAIGDIAFVALGQAALVFRWEGVVLAILSAGRVKVPIEISDLTTGHHLESPGSSVRPDEKISQDREQPENTSKLNSNDEGRNAMHKLAQLWRNWIVVHNLGQPARLEDRGTIDLRNMTDLGVLPEGEYYQDEAGGRHRITATATQIGSLISLQIYETTAGTRWEGFLVFDRGDLGEDMMVAGTKYTPLFVAGRRKVFDQNEEPWVITKP